MIVKQAKRLAVRYDITNGVTLFFILRTFIITGFLEIL